VKENKIKVKYLANRIENVLTRHNYIAELLKLRQGEKFLVVEHKH